MNQDLIKQNGEFVHNFIKDVIDTTGPRLPGTEEEAKGAEMVSSVMEKELGVTPVTEKFKLSPRASIGAIPVLGYLGLVAFALFYLSPIATLVIATGCFIFAVLQIFMYTGALDFMFKKADSQNVYAVLPSKSGKVDYSIMLSGHIDSSWCWNLSVENPKTMLIKTILGVFGFAVMAVVSIIAICNGALTFGYFKTLATLSGGKQIFMIILYCLPVITAPGSYWLSKYLSWDKKKASPGAMDNLTGVGLSIAVAKYFKENPDKQPENCRIICAGLGSEEAGLKGSMAFVKSHKNDDLLKNTININLDSFRDDDHFNVVKGDLWLFSHFDDKLIAMALESMKESGTTPGVIVNPVGGCDSTPLYRAGIRTVTLCAQNPVPTNYYHTYNDTVEGLSAYSIEKGFETVLRLIEKIDAEQKAIKGE